MGDGELLQDPDDIFTQIDFDDCLFDKDFNLFGDDFSHHLLTTEDDDSPSCICIEQQQTPNPPPPSWIIHHIEQILMKDDDVNDNDIEGECKEKKNSDPIEEVLLVEEENQDDDDFCKDIFSHLPVDSPPPVLDQSNDITTIIPNVDDDDVSNPESNISDDKENSDAPPAEPELLNKGSRGEGKIDNDPIDTKKRKRQMRNRDAALRSRERKKLYVRDLEMKSRFLESECTRLQHLLHCYAAENRTLHLHLQKNKPSDAYMAKQESAVLLLESLLLGSLLWLLGIVCLFPLPGLLLLLIHNPSPCPDDVVVKVGSNNQGELAALRAGNKRRYFGTLWLFFRKSRWKSRATRSKMKILFSCISDTRAVLG